MPQWGSTTVLWLLSWLLLANAQYSRPPEYDDVQQIASPIDSNITISYKTPPKGTCTTVFDTQRQFTGYVTIPPNVSGPEEVSYTTNTFFWFVESRQLPETSPLTIFINGGPGSSSMVGLFQELGPCRVVELARDRLGTVAREWGWDRSSNMLFIDQPVQTGFSYDRLVNGTLDLLTQTLAYPPDAASSGKLPRTQLDGVFASNHAATTANTSQLAAESVWHFLQGFLATFPQYRRPLNGTVGSPDLAVNLFTESYGGRYGPAIGRFFEEQNNRRLSEPAFANSTFDVSLKSLGILNGWIDSAVQSPAFPNFAYQNSYGIQTINQVQQLNALSSFHGAGGCQELTITCRSLQLTLDPTGNGNIEQVNTACAAATYSCQANLYSAYLASGRSIYDITQSEFDPFPDALYLEYLNMQQVQEAIGVPVNYTQTSIAVYTAFNESGDWSRGNGIQDLADLLRLGVRVALIYGDRDYVCNWLGGEAISFSIAAAAGPEYSSWYTAGYAPIVANDSYIGGVVREYGNLSFSRIYDAGHLVPAYQPETAFTVFSRIIKGTDVSLGNPVDLSSYISAGEANSTHRNTAPPRADPVCNIRAVNTTCDNDHRNMFANGDGVVINGILYDQESDWTPPDPAVTTQAGVPGAPPSMMTEAPSAETETSDPFDGSTSAGSLSSRLPTGVFTATGVPVVTSTSSDSLAAPTAAIGDRSHAAMIAMAAYLGAHLMI